MNRQEVAERLREHLYDSDGIGGVICDILHLDFDHTTDFEIEDILADLIDPVCHTSVMGYPNKYRVYKKCSACDTTWLEDVYNPPYNYCPNCGARVMQR